MKKEKLSSLTKRDLAAMAKKQGIAGWHGMRKDELIEALSSPQSRRSSKRRTAGAAKSRSNRSSRSKASSSSRSRSSRSNDVVATPIRDLSYRMSAELPNGYGKDRIVLMVRDPYWLHAYWEVTHASVKRAEAALGKDWHTSKPMLRVLDVSAEDTTSAAATCVRDIEIHGGVNNWYIDVKNPPRSFRVDIGYRTGTGRFFVLARSNVVTTPSASVSDVVDENWAGVAEQFEKVYAMSGGNDPASSSLELKELFEERLRRPMGSPTENSFGSGARPQGEKRDFWFQVDAELIVFGATQPGAYVTLSGEPVALRPDGTFTVRFSLPDSRRIIPAVAASADGVEERTIVLAVERNTKELEPMIHDGSD